ncbi:electron transfer flavoprotein subunit alpha/FixB family protein [Deferrisoma palaeochoriense]
MSVWVVVEHRNGEVREVTAELVAAARGLGLGPVTAIVLGGPGETEGPAAALPAGFDRVVRIEHETLRGGNAPAVVEALGRRAEAEGPRLILGAHSAAGMDWAPALAARLGAPLATDVTALGTDDAGFSATRTVYAGKLQARVRLADAPTAVVTLRPGAFAPAEGREAGAAEAATEDLPADLGRRFLEWVQEAAGEVDITQADVLVSVGRGIGDPEDLDVARELAEALGATLSCSRPVVDLGWLPKARQVGISGKTVKPKVYIALGISGAFQHVTAMKDSGLILAVNKDPKAPIFRVAHYGIVGDLFKVVPELTKAVREARG